MFTNLLLALAACLPLPPTDSPAGDYAGWGYIATGGDLPLRVHVAQGENGLVVTLDLPSENAYALPTDAERFADGALHFERTSKSGKRWIVEAKLENGELDGEAQIGDDTRIDFNLVRSAVALPSPAPSIDAANYAGTYRAADGRSIVITSWFWNELRYVDTETGRVGTLFALSDREFFAGSAEYVPAPVASRFNFDLDDAGAANALTMKVSDGEATRFARTRTIEEDITFSNGDVKLAGTLIRPAGDGPHPAVVIVGGSGSYTRGSVRRLADIFSSFGMAVLTFDQRGEGESTGEAICSFHDTASDIAAGAAALRDRSDIRSDAVGVFGVSRGGWFAPLAAANDDDIAFVVVFVAASVSPAEQETTRRLQAMRDAGYGEAELAEARAYLDMLWKATSSEEAWNRYVPARNAIEAKGWGDILGGISEYDSDDARWDRFNMQYDPIPTLERVTCPILALFGENDTNVTPAQNKAPFEAALKRAGNNDSTLVVIAGADHGLRVADLNAPPLPLHRAVGTAPEVWRTVREWLRKRRFAP